MEIWEGPGWLTPDFKGYSVRNPDSSHARKISFTRHNRMIVSAAPMMAKFLSGAMPRLALPLDAFASSGSVSIRDDQCR